MKNSTKYIKLTLLTSVLLKINSGYASQNEYDTNQSASMAPNAMPGTTSSENTPPPLYFNPSPDLINPISSLPQDVQGLIVGNLDNQSLSRYSQTNKTTYNSMNGPQNNWVMEQGISQALSDNSFDLDKPGEKERLISFLQYTQTKNRLVDINITGTFHFRHMIDWSQILPFCTYIRFINLKLINTSFQPNDPEYIDETKHTPLMLGAILSAHYGLHDTTKTLINKKREINPQGLQQDLNFKDIRGNSPLFNACAGDPDDLHKKSEQEELCLELIKAGADVITVNSRGFTPLIKAVSSKKIVVVEAIINKMKEVDAAGFHQYLNQQNWQGKTALMIASEKGYSDIVAILQQAGATQ